jgi:hypothetical protein
MSFIDFDVRVLQIQMFSCEVTTLHSRELFCLIFR